jgi:hypothetical protein
LSKDVAGREETFSSSRAAALIENFERRHHHQPLNVAVDSIRE